MKLVTFEVATPIGPLRRLGALIDGHQDGRVADLTLAYTAYARDQTDEPTPEGLAQVRTPPDMIGWIRGAHRSRRAAEQAVTYVKARLTKEGDPRGRAGEQLVFARSQVKLLAPLPRPNTFRDFSIFEDHGSLRDGDTPDRRRRKPPAWYRWPLLQGKPGLDPRPGGSDSLRVLHEATRPGAGDRHRRGPGGAQPQLRRGPRCDRRLHDRHRLSDRGAAERNALGPAKSKDWATMVGPCLVTAGEVDEANLAVRVLVDGELWFEGNTRMPRSFLAHQLVAYCSDNETVFPGDLLGTGTVGTGCSMDLHRWPQVGQTVRMEVEGIGYMEHRIVQGEHVVDYVGSGMDGLVQPKTGSV